MSGYELNQVVKKRLIKRHTIINKIVIRYSDNDLTDAETIELDGLLGFEESCEKAIAEAETIPLDELERLIKLILAKRMRKAIDEIPAGVA